MFNSIVKGIQNVFKGPDTRTDRGPQEGIVKVWKEANGMGFITPINGAPDIFVCWAQLVCEESGSRWTNRQADRHATETRTDWQTHTQQRERETERERDIIIEKKVVKDIVVKVLRQTSQPCDKLGVRVTNSNSLFVTRRIIIKHVVQNRSKKAMHKKVKEQYFQKCS